MNTLPRTFSRLALVSALALILAACASAPTAPEGAAAVRGKLTQLQGDAQLAPLAPVEIRDAEQAVRAAEQPEEDEAMGRHLVLMADRKVDIATAWAQSRLYVAQRDDLDRQSEQARLDARSRETAQARRETDVARNATDVARSQAATARGDAASARGDAANARDDAAFAQNQAANARDETAIARNQTATARNQADIARDQAETARTQTDIAQSAAATARNETEVARNQTDIARSQAASARRDSAASQQETLELERQIAELNARSTDRGLVVTLGDVLFETGQSAIQGGNTSNLDKLALFLKRYEDRSVSIEGHTDDVGGGDSNLALSQNRANAVRTYLVNAGIVANRLVASGMGESAPVSSNDNATGRQQNRRVEVIIADAAR